MLNTTVPRNAASHSGIGNENGVDNVRHHTRSKRGRQSNNDDSVKLPATKKRRSALRPNTFEPLTASSLNEMAGNHSKDVKVNGNKATARFRQEYKSDNLNVTSGKRLDLIRQGSNWVIVKESSGS